MPHYVCTFTGREIGAIGIFGSHRIVVEADDLDAAHLKIYDTHEHISEWIIRRATADDFTHAFRTLFGMPADTSQQPACGAQVTPGYDFPGWDRPACTACNALVANERVQ